MTWLVGQLDGARPDLVVEAYPKNARTGTAATLEQTREDRYAPLGDDHKEPFRFRVVMRAEMGMGRKTGTQTTGFITTVLNLLQDFYGSVVQQITPWQPPAPKLKQTKQLREVEEDGAFDPFRWAVERPEIEEGDVS